MLIYCVKHRKNTENMNSKTSKTKNLQNNYAIKMCYEATGLLRSLGLKTTLSKFHLWAIFCFKYKIKQIVNKSFLAGDKFMPKIH